MKKIELEVLEKFISTIPAVKTCGKGFSEDEKIWWIKLVVDISHPLAWNVVQELWHILNYISGDERLPTVFMPVSPAPYMNWWPEDFLSWVIESKSSSFTPSECLKWLETRLPRPVYDIAQWNS